MTRLLHYEHVPGRSHGREWRVADENDDVVCSYVTEDAARQYVREQNVLHLRANQTWEYVLDMTQEAL